MKIRTFVPICILALAVLIIAGSCATQKMTYIPKEFEFYGTWVNPDYDDIIANAKATYFPNGKMKLYGKVDSSDYWEGEYVITNKWVDSKGNVWYTSRDQYEGSTQWVYSLIKMSDSGKTMEYAISGSGYPTDLDPNNTTYQYRIVHRQE